VLAAGNPQPRSAHATDVWGVQLIACRTSRLCVAGLKIDPNNASLQDALDQAEAAASGGPDGGLFGQAAIAKLAMDPRTQPLLMQPDFMAMIQAVRSNPAAISAYLNDQRFQLALEVMLGVRMSTGEKFKEEMDADRGARPGGPKRDSTGHEPTEAKRSAPAKQPEAASEPDVEMSELDNEAAEKKKQVGGGG